MYIVEAADGTLYTGVAKGSVSRRINEHLRGQGSRYLLGRGGLRLRHQEAWPDQSAACRREAQIKRWTRKKKLALIGLNRFFVWELPILGPRVALVRFVASAGVPPLIGWLGGWLYRALHFSA